MKSVLTFAGDYIYSSSRKPSTALEISTEGFRKMLKSYVILTCIIVTSMSAVAFGPIRVFLVHGKWMTPLGIQFPLADVSNVAFYTDLTIQIVIAFIGILTTVSIEMVQVIINNAVELAADVITLNLSTLGQQLVYDKRLSTASAAQLRNVCVQIQDFNR